MKRALALTSVLVLVATGCGPEASPPPTQTVPSTAADEGAPTPDAQVADWLDRAASAPHNGMNPELALAPELLRDGASAFQQAIATGTPQRRHDAASALTRHPEPASQRAFWLTQLESEDPIVRFYASTSIADVHAAEDFEPFVRATFGRGDLLTLAARARDFGDRRAVPLLVDSLGGDRVIAANAALSLSMSPGVPDLPAEQLDPDATAAHLPNGAWRAPETSRVAPHQRWWQSEGRASFATECAWWVTIAPASTACAP
jgi:hypothetical protein